jgi:hypothetical protein
VNNIIASLKELQKTNPQQWQTKESVLRLISIHDSLIDTNVLKKLYIALDDFIIDPKKYDQLVLNLLEIIVKKWYLKKIETDEFIIFESKDYIVIIFKISEKINYGNLMNELKSFTLDDLNITYNDIPINNINKEQAFNVNNGGKILNQNIEHKIKEIENFNLKLVKIIGVKQVIKS